MSTNAKGYEMPNPYEEKEICDCGSNWKLDECDGEVICGGCREEKELNEVTLENETLDQVAA